MSKIIAQVPKDVVVDSRRNIIGAGLVVFFGEQGDDPIETAEDIYAKVDGVETYIGKFVEIKESGQFYYNDNPVSIFIKGSLNKYVSCGLYQKVGSKLSQIDYIGSSPGFTAAQMLGEQLVQNIRSKAGYKRHFVSMSEAQSYQDYKLNQVVFISEVNNDQKLAGQFIIKLSESNIVDNITNFTTTIDRYVLQRITGAYPYKNTLQVTAKSIDDIHKFMYHLKIAGNFKCTLVVDYDFTTENLDLTIFKKVIFNKFVRLFKGISANEVSFLDSGLEETTYFSMIPPYWLADDDADMFRFLDEYLMLRSNSYRGKCIKSLISNCRIEKITIQNFHALYIKDSLINNFTGTPATGARLESKVDNVNAILITPIFIVYGSNVNFSNTSITYSFYDQSQRGALNSIEDRRWVQPGSYGISFSKVSFNKCSIKPHTDKSNYIYKNSEEAKCVNPKILSSNVDFYESNISGEFLYLSTGSYLKNAVNGYPGYIFKYTPSGIETSFSVLKLYETLIAQPDFKMNINMLGDGYYLGSFSAIEASNNSVYYKYNGSVAVNKDCISPFINIKNISSTVLVYNNSYQPSPLVINHNLGSAVSVAAPYTRGDFSIKKAYIKSTTLPIWSNAIRQNSTNVLNGTALPGFLSVGEHPNDGEFTYTPVPTD